MGINKASSSNKTIVKSAGANQSVQYKGLQEQKVPTREKQKKKKEKKFFIEDELLSHIIQCFLEAVGLTSPSNQQTKGTLHLHL